MLTVNPAKRINATEALKHPWICVNIIIDERIIGYCFISLNINLYLKMVAYKELFFKNFLKVKDSK